MAAVKTLLTWEAFSSVPAGALEIDATTLLGFETAAEIPEHPVEEGPAVSDHIRPMNGVITLEGVITNHPIILPSTQMNGATLASASVTLPDGSRATAWKFSAEVDRVRACDAAIQSVIDGGALVSLSAGLRSVDGLGFARYRAERNADTGESVKVTMELRKVRIATTARAPVPLVRRAQVQLERGAQPADNRTAAARLQDTAPMQALGRLLAGG